MVRRVCRAQICRAGAAQSVGTVRGGLAATRREFMNGVPSLNPLRNDSGGTSRVERYSAARRIVRNTVGVATLR